MGEKFARVKVMQKKSTYFLRDCNRNCKHIDGSAWVIEEESIVCIKYCDDHVKDDVPRRKVEEASN